MSTRLLGAGQRPAPLIGAILHVSLGLPLLWLMIWAVIYLVGWIPPLALYESVVRTIVAPVETIAVLYWLAALTRFEVRLDAMSVCLLLMLSVGTAIGLVHLVAADSEYSERFLLPHFAAALLAFSCYTVFSNWHGRLDDWLIRTIDRYSVAALVVTSIYLTAFIRDWLLNRTYWGPSTGALLLSFAWFASRQRWKLAIVSALLILANGKRATGVALLADTIIIGAFFLSRASRRQRLVAGVVGVVVAGGIAMAASAVVSDKGDRTTTTAILGATLDKWSALNTTAAGFDINYATAGRFFETVGAARAFGAIPSHWWTGTGFGWSFEEYPEYRLHYLHLSPANYVIQFGVPLAAVFLCMIVVTVGRGIANGYRNFPHDTLSLAIPLMLVGSLVDGLFSYTYGTDPFMWIGLGVLVARQRSRDLMSRQITAFPAVVPNSEMS